MYVNFGAIKNFNLKTLSSQVKKKQREDEIHKMAEKMKYEWRQHSMLKGI